MPHKFLVMLVAALMLSACQTTNPYTGEAQTNKTTIGASTGAVLGGIVGALVDGKNGALAGAALGGAAGGSWGYYLDQQADTLKVQLRGTGVSVKRQGNQLILVMPGDITFASSQSQLKPEFLPVLDSVAKVLLKFDQTRIIIQGYTDSTGGPDINDPLSQARANSVFHYLNSRTIRGERMEPQGYGARNPIASNATAAGRAKNRRVELHLVQAS